MKAMITINMEMMTMSRTFRVYDTHGPKSKHFSLFSTKNNKECPYSSIQDYCTW